MALKDILLHLVSYPVRTPPDVVAAAVAMADLLGAETTAAIREVAIRDPSNMLTRALTDIGAAIAGENAKSRAASHELACEFHTAADRPERRASIVTLDCGSAIEARGLLTHARLHDLTIMPVTRDEAVQFVAQELIFGSGRPVLLVPAHAKPSALLAMAVVAWDGSRVAARAVADAVPFLELANTVRLIKITGDKPLDADDGLDALRSHLYRHGIDASVDSEPLSYGEGAGEAIARYCYRNDAGLLVMGAYGHSRVRDFIVGGATKHFMAETPLPVLLSH